MTVLVVDNPFEVRFIEDLFGLGSTEQESSAADVVNLARDALGVIRDAGQETVAEDLGLGAGDAEMMLDVGDGFLEVKGTEMVPDGDTLVESLVRRETEELGQVRLPEQDQGQ